MMPPAIATSAPMPDTNPERTPVVIAGAASSTALPRRFQLALLDADRVGVTCHLVDCVVDRRADVVGLFGHAADGSDQDAGHQEEETEHDHRRGQRGLELASFEHFDQRSEAHGQDGRERHREEDLADKGQPDGDENERDDEADEAPGPHPHARNPAQGRGDGVRARLGCPGSVGAETRRRTPPSS